MRPVGDSFVSGRRQKNQLELGFGAVSGGEASALSLALSNAALALLGLPCLAPPGTP